MANKVYRVGRYQGNKLIFCCKLQQKKDGGLGIFQTAAGFDTNDMSTLIAHFGRMLRSTTGVGVEQHRRSFKPGTKEHFEHAVCVLPPPFALMRRSA